MNDRCLAGEACTSLTTDGAAVTSQPLCHGCCAKIQSQYDQLPEILRVLPLFKGGLWGESGEAKVSKGKGEAPIPLNVHCLDVIDLIQDILADIGNLRITDLARHEDGVRRALLVNTAWKQADGVIGFVKPALRRFGDCPDCGLRTLIQLPPRFSPGKDASEELKALAHAERVIRCTSCGGSMTRNEYEVHLVAPKKKVVDK